MLALKELTAEDFNYYVDKYDIKSVYQTAPYGETMLKSGYEIFYLGMMDETGIMQGLTLVLVEKNGKIKYGYAPRGFLINYNNIELVATFTKLIKKFFGKMDVIAIKLSPAIVRNIYDSDGKIIETNENYDQIFSNLKKLGYSHLGYNDFFEAHKPRFEAILDLNKPYYETFKDIKKEFRSKIRGAENNYIEVHKGNFNNLNYLYLQTKNKYPRDLDYFKNLYYYFKQDNKIEFYYTKIDTAKLLTKIQDDYKKQDEMSVELGNQIMYSDANSKINLVNQKMSSDDLANKYKKQLIAATDLLKNNPEGAVTSSILIVKHGDTIYMMIDGTDANLKGFNSKHLLYWKLIEKCSKLGFKKFNLGGVSNITIEDSKYSGLNNFKLSFNSKVYEYMGDLELVTNSTLYFMYQNTLPFKNIMKNK